MGILDIPKEQTSLTVVLGIIAHRVLIVRKLKGLEDILPFTCVHWHLELNVDKNNSGSKDFLPYFSFLESNKQSFSNLGWRFATAVETIPERNMRPDPLHPTYTHLSQLYLAQEPGYSGRYTVPLLYDTKTNQIVSNESSEILRMLYTEFNELLPAKFVEIDLFPMNLRKVIEETNDWTYHEINNGVYKSGASMKQKAYEEAVKALFRALDRAEKHLARSPGPFYYGSFITESDVRLYVTVVRFDPVYHQHFKCNVRDIRSGYPALHKWLRRLYWGEDAFKSTTDFQHIKNHYTKSHLRLNPAGITALGPVPHILGLEEEVAAVEATLVKADIEAEKQGIC